MFEFIFSDEERLEHANRGERIINNYFSKKNNHFLCHCDKCTKKAVNSHAISKQISLQTISEKGMLKYFESRRIGPHSKELACVSIGINDATTFKGFCESHEIEFNILDKNSNKNSIYEILLQCYRSICFSLFQAKSTEPLFEDIRAFLNTALTDDLINEAISKELKSKAENIDDEIVTKFRKEVITDDVINKLLEELINDHEDNYTKEYRILQAYKNTIEKKLSTNKSDDSIYHENGKVFSEYVFNEGNCDLCILYKKLDYKIPIAMLNQHFLEVKGIKNILLFTVIPYNDSTEIYWIFDKKFFAVYKYNWDEMMKSDMRIINRIESSMIHCENWFIDPKIIDSMPSSRLQIIKDDIYFANERSPFSDYDLSFFDELRKQKIPSLDSNLKYKEMKKMCETIERPPFNQRMESLNKYIYDMI